MEYNKEKLNKKNKTFLVFESTKKKVLLNESEDKEFQDFIEEKANLVAHLKYSEQMI